MTSGVVKDDFKNGTWWKNRTQLERTLLFIIAFIVAIAIVLAVSVAVLKARDPAKKICLTPGCVKAASSVLKYINVSVDPCDDFYEFACGNFLSTNTIPDDKTQLSQFSIVDDELQERLRLLVQQPERPEELKAFRLVKQLYKTCMNVTRIEEMGLATIKEIVKELGGWPVVVGSAWNERDFDWKKTTYQLRHMGFSDDHFISIHIGQDDNNSTKRVLKIDQASLGLSRKILIKGFNETLVKAYYEYMVDVAVIFGADRNQALKELKDSVELEIKLANISIPSEERRNATLEYNPMTISQLQETYPTIPWLKSVNMMLAPILTVDEDETIIVTVPKYFKALEDVLRKTSKRTQANYLLWNTVRDAIPFLNDEIRRRQLKFSTVVTGRTERQSRWKECIDSASSLQIAAGSMYVRKYFQADAKEKVMEMVGDIQDQFQEILKTSTWIDPVTKKSAVNKADKMVTHIGHPPELLDDNKVEEYYQNLQIDPENYLRTNLNLSLFYTEKVIRRFREPVNKTDWRSHSFPAIVNAFYDSLENSIQFPAGILQGTFFGEDRPQYLNYGGIGFVIGHEITHGFDDEGRQYDVNGNLVDWWEPETHEAFAEKAKCIIEQYGNYSVPEVDMQLNGINTQGENIADNGGIKEAYLAYLRWVKRNGPEQKLPGLKYTPRQLFWIAAANTWCSKTRPESLKLQVLNGYHAPAKFRILGPFSNSKYFSKDFNCPAGTPMNPEHKCEVW